MTVDHDLPDPPPPQYRSPEEQLEHRWKMAWALFTFAFIYSLIHKVFVPLFLSRFPVLVKEYTVVDYWFVPVLIFWFVVLLTKVLGKWGSFWAGATAAYMILESFAIARSDYVGWLLWSRALSSVPVGLLAIYLMTFTNKKRNIPWAWAGAILIIPVFIFTHLESKAPSIEEQTSIYSAEETERVWFASANFCGHSVYSLDLKNSLLSFSSSEKHTSLKVSDCGFEPQVHIVGDDPLKLVRPEDLKMNGHLLFFSQDFKKLRNWNQVLPQSSQIKIPQSLFQSGEVLALFYSDMRPDLGVVLLLSDKALRDGVFNAVKHIHVLKGRSISIEFEAAQ